MTNKLEITSLSKDNEKVTVSWENGLKDVSSLSVTFDDDGSCSTLFVDPAKDEATIESLCAGNYDVFLTAISGVEKVYSDRLSIVI
jgi:hypothetical protein